MFDGRLSEDISARKATTELLGAWMTGGFVDEAEATGAAA